MQTLRGQRVTVAGLGRFGGGIAVARWLVGQGARVLVTDQASEEKLAESVAQLEGLDLAFHLGGFRADDFTRADLIVASPAIALSHPMLAAARDAGVPLTTEIRLFVERCPGLVIGVTGTKGKSTTTALLERMAKTRFTVWAGGNIGVSLLPDLDHIDKTHIVILELSSFMLEHLGAMRWSPHVAVVTMLTADHLEWHGSVEAYVAAKCNIVRYQRPDDFACINESDPPSRALAQATTARLVSFGMPGLDRPAIPLRLPGEHNQLNAQAALAAATTLGVSFSEACEAVGDFGGLPHRLELVCERNGVQYYDDSIATVPEAAIAALNAFPPRHVIQIVGGYDAGQPLTALCGALVERAKAVLCIGVTGKPMAALMGQAARIGAASVYDCGDLPTAMKIARSIAADGDLVLLSPCAKSFDQFVNYELRGKLFSELAAEG